MSSPSLITSFHAISLALQPQAEASRNGVSWGGTATVELNGVHVPHIERIRLSGLPAIHLNVLDRLVRGEEVPLAEIANLHSVLVYAQSLLQQSSPADQAGSQNGATPHQRLTRVTGQLRGSIVPPSLRADSLAAMAAAYGKPIEAADVPTKHVRAAILFTDFSQFSRQSKGAQSKYIIDRLNRYFEALIPIAQKMGGVVNKLVGDAIMAFWYDASNNSLKAVQAALAMQEATRNIVEDLMKEASHHDLFGEKLAQRGLTFDTLSHEDYLQIAREIDPLIPVMKVGINTGWVSYGKLGAKAPYYSEITVIGDAVNTAARMEANCEPGQICISQATQSDLPEGMFDLSDLGPVEAKNIGMVQAFSVLRENRLFAVNGNTHKSAKIIHGRDSEIEMLTDMFLDAVEKTSPRMAMLIGNPGEGKSTIANHFLGRVKSEDFELGDVDIVYARGEDQPEFEPYQVIADALRIRAGVELGGNQEGSEQRRQRRIENEMKVRAFIESAFTGTTKDRGLASEILGHFLDTPFEKRSDQMEYLLKNHADLNSQTVEAIIEIFEGLSRRRPVILVVDDMQWTDSGTRNLMHTLLSRLTKSPLMILGMRRPEATDPLPADEPDWLVENVDIIQLNPLKDGDLGQIVRETLGPAVDPSVVRDILERAAYNPLFVHEIATEMKNGMSLDNMPTTVQNL
ncbi:MAG TPA: adenylate/guanylate cyclase domain-containing protein, partial [bacterium]|nr:adenylate/guanylate cyclase domain-containing protein [bacterium]